MRFAACWILCLLASPVLAHPSHSSYAEIEWSETGHLNVAWQVIPEDLERALSATADAPMVLVDSQTVRDAIHHYLAENFYLADSDETSAKSIGESVARKPLVTELAVVGMELGYRDTWIYFSIRGDVPQSATLTNTLLFDVQPTQVNRVKALWAPEEATLVFTATEPRRPLVVSTQ